MAIEYKLPYTAFEIGDKLRTVDEVKTALENDYCTKSEVSTSFEAVNESIGEVTASLKNKADLIDGKIPLEKLPDDVSSNVDLSNYYTKPETDEALSLKADLVDGKIPAEQLPDNIGGNGGSGSGSLEQIQADFAQNDDTQVDYIKNRPFYDTRVRSYYSQAENPNPVSFDCAPIGYSFYKISDLVPTREEIFSTMKILALHDGVSDITPPESAILVETEDFIATNDGNWGFSFVNKPGVLNFTFSGYSLSINVSEAGIYYIRPLGSGVPEGRIFEIIVGGELKTLDPKYLPQGGVGYEKGEKILWDGKPTDTYIQPGQIIEWDGSDTGVAISIPANEETGIPEGVAFYKVAEKLDSLFGWTYQVTNGSTVTLNSEEIGTMSDDSGNVIATYGDSNTMWVWNVEQAVSANIMGVDVTFPETGLYFINIEGMLRIESMYNPIYENLGDVKLYKIAEPLNDDLNGYRMNITADGENIDVVIVDNPESDGEAYYGSTETGSSYGLPYIFNIVTDNESVDCMDTFGAIFKFEKAGLYVIDVVAMGATFNFLAGKDYEVIKVDEKFLPEGMQLKSELRTWIDGSDDYYPTTGAIYRALGGRNQLSIQSDVNSWSSDPVSSSAVYNALGGRERLTIDSDVTSYSTNPVSSQAVYNAIQNIQIDVDSSVQSGSNNAVSGSAVYKAIQNIDLSSKQDKVSVTSSDNGKFMRVVDGAWAAVAVPNAEDGEF